MNISIIWSRYIGSCLAVLFLGLCISIIQQRQQQQYHHQLYRSTQHSSVPVTATTHHFKTSHHTRTSTSRSIKTATMGSSTSNNSSTTTTRPPVYFLGIGGPNFLEMPSHPAAAKLAETGLEITQQVKPKAVVVVSAHWQQPAGGAGRVSIVGGGSGSGSMRVSVNVAEDEGIIYDFHGFPKRFYEHEYPYRGSAEIAEKVVGKLEGSGIEVDKVRRGLDHGVWVGFLAAFDPKKNPLNMPIVQVSLLAEEDADAHYKLGQALSSLRDEGILVIGAGMAVHNLNDYRAIRANGGTVSYSSSFDDLLEDAVATKPEVRQAALTKLLATSEAKQAHPSLEHILPVVVAAGAAGEDAGERLWTFAETSLNWAQYRFGKVQAA